MSAGGAVGTLQLRDVGRTLGRYRGYVLLAAGIALLSAILPGPTETSETTGTEQPASTSTVDAP